MCMTLRLYQGRGELGTGSKNRRDARRGPVSPSKSVFPHEASRRGRRLRTSIGVKVSSFGMPAELWCRTAISRCRLQARLGSLPRFGRLNKVVGRMRQADFSVRIAARLIEGRTLPVSAQVLHCNLN